MKRALVVWVMGCALLACAAQRSEAGPRLVRTAADRPREPRRAVAPEPPPSPSQLAERQEKKVAVQGIVGTLSNFDVRTTLDKRNKDFAKCHEPRARTVPELAGSVEFKVHVLRDGKVAAVQVSDSDLGDRVLERCLSEVIRAAKFPEPHGGEADVEYKMSLAPAGPAREPEHWEHDRVKRVLQKRSGALLDTCDARGAGLFTVTAYVAPSGRVLAAGVAARNAASSAQFDCIADELQSWPMPKPKKGIAKVSFPIRTGA